MIIYARYWLFLAIAAIVIVMLGFYGRTKDTALLAMGAIVLTVVVIGGLNVSMHWSMVAIALGAAIAIGFASRKRR